MTQLSSHCQPDSSLHVDAGHARPNLLDDEERLTGLVAEGLSTSEISARLALPASDVQALMAQVLHKLGFSDPLELILYSYSVESRLRM
jgi:DNA-binding NarL/FixJ family response regulator